MFDHDFLLRKAKIGGAAVQSGAWLGSVGNPENPSLIWRSEKEA
jgi:hypothetical protein